MPTITKRGREFARELAPYVEGAPMAVVEQICSLIARHATTHHSYMEAECNRELRASERRKIEQIEARITALVAQLPPYQGQPLTAKFTGDPRGFTVRVVVPDKSAGNTWGRDGEFGV